MSARSLRAAAVATLLAAALAPRLVAEVVLKPVVFAGGRSVADSRIQAVYGSALGMVIVPQVGAQVWKGLSVGAAYELGFRRKGLIGLQTESAVLRVSGLDLFASYELRSKALGVYLKSGLGLYHYAQEIDTANPFILDRPIDGTKATIVFGGGFEIRLTPSLFVGGEVKIVPLKVKPYDVEVDLGGLRLLGGIGYAFRIGG